MCMSLKMRYRISYNTILNQLLALVMMIIKTDFQERKNGNDDMAA